ncbi:MAG: hypothetical protein U1F43_33505 [Myxococcota bacterium]
MTPASAARAARRTRRERAATSASASATPTTPRSLAPPAQPPPSVSASGSVAMAVRYTSVPAHTCGLATRASNVAVPGTVTKVSPSHAPVATKRSSSVRARAFCALLPRMPAARRSFVT